MVYTIGVSFTAELALKAAYEETLGRVFRGLAGGLTMPMWTICRRGRRRTTRSSCSRPRGTNGTSPVTQPPWMPQQRRSCATGSGRWRAGAGVPGEGEAYAKVIEAAVAAVGADQLRLRRRGQRTARGDAWRTCPRCR